MAAGFMQLQSLPYPWSCKKVSGESIGICQLEKRAFNCCKTYCGPGNRTYIAHLRSDLRKLARSSKVGAYDLGLVGNLGWGP